MNCFSKKCCEKKQFLNNDITAENRKFILNYDMGTGSRITSSIAKGCLPRHDINTFDCVTSTYPKFQFVSSSKSERREGGGKGREDVIDATLQFSCCIAWGIAGTHEYRANVTPSRAF